MEMEQKNKVIKLNEDPMGNEEEVKVDAGGERDENELSDIDKLPNEILMKILDYLDEQPLVKCRLLSSRWNDICCFLLQDKSKNNPYSRLVVQLRKANGKNHLTCKTIIEKALGAFIKCFSQSKAEKSSRNRRPFPFFRFHIQDFSYLRDGQMLQFVSTFGPHIKSLTLDIYPEDCDNFVKFWKLLLEYAPNIQHLGMTGGPWLNKLKLFNSDSASSTSSSSNENINVPSLLENLKSIKVTKDNNFDGFMKELLNHAPNLKEVMTSDFTRCRVRELEDFALWHRLEKSHLIKKFEILDDSQNYLPLADLMKNVRLNYFRADCSLFFRPKDNGISYVAHALKSSQDSLSSLRLENLTTENMNRCFKDISSLPNVQKLEIEMMRTDDDEIVNIITRFSKMCPNLTHLIIDVLHGDFLRIAPILWTQFKGLKFLKLRLFMNDEAHGGINDVLSLTSGFSGYSNESLEIIEEKLDQGFSVEEARRDEPQEASIFDLKDLSRLEVICLFPKRIYKMENEKKMVKESLLVKILPQHIRENPRTFDYHSTRDTTKQEFDIHCACCCPRCGKLGYDNGDESNESDSDLESYVTDSDLGSDESDLDLEYIE